MIHCHDYRNTWVVCLKFQGEGRWEGKEKWKITEWEGERKEKWDRSIAEGNQETRRIGIRKARQHRLASRQCLDEEAKKKKKELGCHEQRRDKLRQICANINWNQS